MPSLYLLAPAGTLDWTPAFGSTKSNYRGKFE
jgi:hypothetical protein